MDHLEATSLGATEKYLLGTLDQSQRDAFEEHFFDCLECGEDLRAASALLAGVRCLPQAIPDARRKPAAARAARRWWRIDPGRRSFLAAASGLAAALSIVAYQGIVVIPRLEQEVESSDSLRAVASHFLTQTRSDAPLVLVGPEDRLVALTLSATWDTSSFTSYRCQLQDVSGRVLLDEKLPSRSVTDELELLLPVRNLPAGPYVLVVEVDATPDGSGAKSIPARGSAPVARYAFNLQRQGSPGSSARPK